MGGLIGRAATSRNDSRTARLAAKLLAAATAAAGAAGARLLEIYLEHFKGSFGDKWMWTPIVLSPPLAAAGVAGIVSERAAQTWLPAVSGALRARRRDRDRHPRPGRSARSPAASREPTYNLVMGPPLLAPGSLVDGGCVRRLPGRRWCARER